VQDGLTIPDEIKRREDRIARHREATQAMEARAAERLIEEQAAYHEKLAARQAKEQSTGKKPKGKPPEPPKEGPRHQDQYNFTDPESRIMEVRGGFEQSYNAQAAVEVTTMLIVGQHGTRQANAKHPPVPTTPALHPAPPHRARPRGRVPSGPPCAPDRRGSSSRRPSSDRSVATTTFPQRSTGIARASQYATTALAPATHSSAFSDPGV